MIMSVRKDDRKDCKFFDENVVSYVTDEREDEFNSITEYACGCVKRCYNEYTPGCRCHDTYFDCDKCKLGIYRKDDES